MFNLKKISKVVVIASTLAFAFLLPLASNAQDVYSNPAIGKALGSISSKSIYKDGKWYQEGSSGEQLRIVSEAEMAAMSEEERENGSFEVISDAQMAKVNSLRQTIKPVSSGSSSPAPAAAANTSDTKAAASSPNSKGTTASELLNSSQVANPVAMPSTNQRSHSEAGATVNSAAPVNSAATLTGAAPELKPMQTGSLTVNQATTAEKAGASKDVWAVEQQKYEQANQAYTQKLAAANKEIAAAQQKCTQTGNCNDLDVAQEKYAALQATEGAEVSKLRSAAQAAEKEADQINKQANKELIKAENQNAKDIKNAQKAAEKAQKNIDKFCSGTSDKDIAKCQEAKTSYELAIQEGNKAQAKQSELASQRAATQQSDIDGINKQSNQEMAAAKKSQYSATAEEAAAAKDNYNAMKNAVSEAQAKLNEDKARCGNGDQAACARSAANEKALSDAKVEAQKAYDEMQEKTSNPAPDEATAAKSLLADSEAKAATAEQKVQSLQTQLDAANKACTQASALTSRSGKKQAEQFCSQAAQLEQQLLAAQNELTAANAAAALAKNDLNIAQLGSGYEEDHRGQEYRAFATSAEYAGATGTDVFKLITRRAFIFLVGLKPIVYTFAGFGLIAFAWMAIFNKLSWKWFSNIAIGLFLVANMGRFIEYFVFPSYDIEGDIETKPLKYGDYLSKGFADSEYMWVDASADFVPEKQVGEEEIPSSDATTPEYKNKARGFCGKTAGATGWANFTSCIGDIVATGKKAVDTVKTAQNTINSVKAGVEQVKAAARNIGDAASNIKGGGVSGFVKAVGQIGSNASAMVNVTGGVVGTTMSNVSKVSNNVQDIGKSTDQVAELREQRSKGQATNAVDRFMKGQTKDADGNVEQLIKTDKNGNPIVDKDGNLVMGDYASDRNFATGLKDVTEKVVDKNKDLNSNLQKVTKTAYEGAVAVENFDLQTKGFKTIAERRMEKNHNKAQAKIEAKNQAQRQKEQAKTQEVKDQRLVDKFKQETAASTSQTNVAKQAWQEAQKASENAQAAAQEADRKQFQAETAQKDFTQKESVASVAEDNAKRLEDKAAQSGSESDKQAAEKARRQAELARAEANAAKTKYDSASNEAIQAQQKAKETASVVSDLNEKARAEAAKEAARVAEEAKKQASTDLTDIKKEVDQKATAAQQAQEAASKALEEAKASNDVEAIKKATEAKNVADKAAADLKTTQQKYDNAVKEQKEAAARAAQAELFQKQVENSVVQPVKELPAQTQEAKNAWNQAQKASEKAQAAAQEAERKQYAAETAERTYSQKESAATTAETNAAMLEKKAEQTGNSYDKQVAERARKQAEIARAEANAAQAKQQAAKQAADEAKRKAEEVSKPVADLTEKARSEAAKEAQRVAQEYKQQADIDVNSFAADMNNKAKSAETAQKVAEQAQKRAESSGSEADKQKAAQAKLAADKAAAEYQASQQKLAAAQKLQAEAAERAAKAELFQKQVENGGYLITADEKKQQEAEKKAEELRQKYQQMANPTKQAEYTQQKANRADSEARSAEAAAESARKQAEELKRQAELAAAQAKNSKNPVDQRRAEQLKNQASLAEKQAVEAKSKVIETKAPAIKAANIARDTALIEAQYNQDVSKQQMAELETKISVAKDNAKAMNQAYQAAQAEAQRLAQIAAGDRDTASVLAANEAAQKARAAQEASRKAQLEIDEQIRARAKAEQMYYAERTRQAELEEQKKADSKALQEYLKTLTPAEQETLKKLLAGSSTN